MRFIYIVIIFFLAGVYSIAQSIQSRNNFDALLEPEGKVISGAGQYFPESFNSYWNVMDQNNKPAIFMTYIRLKGLQRNWADTLKNELLLHGNQFIIPQIGLTMTSDGKPSSHYEDSVALGYYDTEINNLIAGLKSLAIPAFLRIGFEFNGLVWNGYEPETYKEAFIRITNMIRTSKLEIATVWCLSMDGEMNYIDYYPGDSYVDWWGIDIFSASDFSTSDAIGFLDSATAHQKPVMIGETTPREVGVLDGQQSWNNWFFPFFNFIHTQPSVKAFCYINWDWYQYRDLGDWGDWGDAQLQDNSLVADSFNLELNSSFYLNSSDEGTFRTKFGISDNSLPFPPQNFSVVSNNYPLGLNWASVTDPSGLSHYIIYKNSELSDYTLETTYQDYNISAGDTVTYNVTAMDRAGNESLTSTIIANIPDTINKAINGDFEEGTQNWDLYTKDSQKNAADFEIDSTSPISGEKSARVTITQSLGNSQDIQLFKSFNVYANRKYKFEFIGKASAEKTIDLVVQQSKDPYAIYLNKQIFLTSDINTFSDTMTANANDTVKLEFFLGSSVTTDIWIDNVSIIEYVPQTTIAAKLKVFLEGPYAGHDSMYATLKQKGLIPFSQPYSTSPWNYYGGESIENIPTGVVDWVLVELRSTYNGVAKARRAAFLMSDGSVYDTNGSDHISFSGASAGNYYIVIKHRNHLAVMSADSISLPNNSTYDFTTDRTRAYSKGSNPMADLGDGMYGMWAGDANRNGQITYNGASNDKNSVLSEVGLLTPNNVVTGYSDNDINMDGIVSYNGISNDKNKILGIVGLLTSNNILTTQVP